MKYATNERTTPYRPIGDYALIGDGHTASLVAVDGSIDWCCCPQFDSPALFCRLLDARIGGWCRIGPAGRFSAARAYRGDTNVLTTTFDAPGGRWQVTDFMTMQESGIGKQHPAHADSSHRIFRLIEGLEGDTEAVVEFRPTFDFARARTRIDITSDGACAYSDCESMAIRSPVALRIDERGAARARWSLRGGQRLWFVVEYRPTTAPSAKPMVDSEAQLRQTIEYWSRWSARCSYEGPCHPLVRRSALTLKLLTFAPTGAIIAAPTTSLPEQLGGVRNWDYRYTWLRDAALTLYALQSIGYHEEADAFFGWLERLCLCCSEGLQIVYTIDAETDFAERTLDPLEGYRGSRPVRIGNAAFMQRQLDAYGEVLDAAHLHVGMDRHPLSADTWTVLHHFADIAAARWRELDQGIWEVRGPPQPFLYSKLMCWVALDRAIKISESTGLPADIPHWSRTREEIRSALLNRGYNAEIGAFTQALGAPVLDASALALPLVGFLPASDARVQSTVDRIRERLTSNGFVYRYFTRETDDGLPGDEGAFVLCSFWLVDNLALGGRINEARELFERIVGYANDVGLLAEEIDPNSGDLLGNFPQGFTHLGLIRAALSIAKAESRGPELRAEAPAERARKAHQASRRRSSIG